VIRNTLSRASSLVTVDLTLKDVVVVEGFYVNIISEARLRVLGV
jgi:hypothetical protein